MHTDSQVVTLIFTIVTGVGVLLQAAVLLGMFLGLRETQKKIHALTEKIEEHVLPLMHNSRGLLDDLTPKIKTIASNLVDVSNTLKTQTQNVKTVVEDVTERTKKQTARADGMVTGALNTLANAGAALERGIAAPLRQVSGVLNGLRAGIDTLRVKESGAGRQATPRVSSAARVPLATPPAAGVTASPLRSVIPVADTLRPTFSATASATNAYTSDTSLQDAVDRIVNAERNAVPISETTPEEASAAAARFVRDRAAATSSDRR